MSRRRIFLTGKLWEQQRENQNLDDYRDVALFSGANANTSAVLNYPENNWFSDGTPIEDQLTQI